MTTKLCGRYYIADWVIDGLDEIIDEEAQDNYEKYKNMEVFPSNKVPIIVNKKDKLSLDTIDWGYPRIDKKGLIINARSETIEDKQIFRNGIFNNRVVIPCSNYFEWNGKKEKVSISHKDDSLVFMAGIIDEFDNENKFVIITTKANDSVKEVHDRMPLILTKDEVGKWIFDNKAFEKMLDKTPQDLKTYQEIEQQTMF